MTPEELIDLALRLPPSDRANLARELLSSLDGLTESEVEALWVEEAERRLTELESGDPEFSLHVDDILYGERD